MATLTKSCIKLKNNQHSFKDRFSNTVFGKFLMNLGVYDSIVSWTQSF